MLFLAILWLGWILIISFLELVERRKGARIRVLNQVLGVAGIARHAKRRSIQLVKENQGVTLEALSTLFVALDWSAAGRLGMGHGTGPSVRVETGLVARRARRRCACPSG